MWGLINIGVRLASRIFFPRPWLKYILLAILALLLILTTLLIDAKLYWTAGMTGLCALAVLTTLGLQIAQISRQKAERERQRTEAVARRAAAAKARSQKI